SRRDAPVTSAMARSGVCRVRFCRWLADGELLDAPVHDLEVQDALLEPAAGGAIEADGDDGDERVVALGAHPVAVLADLDDAEVRHPPVFHLALRLERPGSQGTQDPRRSLAFPAPVVGVRGDIREDEVDAGPCCGAGRGVHVPPPGAVPVGLCRHDRRWVRQVATQGAGAFARAMLCRARRLSWMPAFDQSDGCHRDRTTICVIHADTWFNDSYSLHELLTTRDQHLIRLEPRFGRGNRLLLIVEFDRKLLL